MFGVTIPSTFLPGVVVPGILFGIVFAWPWIEARWITKDRAEHHMRSVPGTSRCARRWAWRAWPSSS
jgi:ubiquinol-cytochrome c reductase cytochrome b subunit